MPDSSILADVDKVINDQLGLKTSRFMYKRNGWRLLSKETTLDFDGKALIQKILDQVKVNWHKEKSHSDNQNWRWKKNPKIDPKNTSQEAILERWIVRTTGADWVNQVPVASGLTRSAGGRRAIDLVHQCGDGWYEFIELKVRGGTPLFAAMEILQYGVLYIFSRENAQTLGYKETGNKLLRATGIHLKVMAPAAYYEGYDLSWLEKSINGGLANFLDKRKFKMDFKFEPLLLTWMSALR